mmetsp:Transcript_28642/g.62320  ORF Transcript_28642/g.62320 Transcript_28642/m.62320 type:complete len:622 (-) Transcript_28642:418-2283(-)
MSFADDLPWVPPTGSSPDASSDSQPRHPPQEKTFGSLTYQSYRSERTNRYDAASRTPTSSILLRDNQFGLSSVAYHGGVSRNESGSLQHKGISGRSLGKRSVEEEGARESGTDVEVGHQSTLSSESDDLTFCNKAFVFFALSLGVQGFLSYSGGATPASLPAIEAANPGLTQFQISLLGSLDKIGQVVASPFWGRALQHCATKWLLVLGLFLNAGASLAFGFVRSKEAMFAAKFIQGCTESQQIIWGNVWTTAKAPMHLLSTWMNLGGVAAGVGTAVGQAVAGFSNAGGMPYSFAYCVQAGGLLLLWFLLLVSPSRWVALKRTGTPSAPLVEAQPGVKKSSILGDIKTLFRRRLYILTMLCVAENNFIVGGLQFFWTRFFCNGPWTLPLQTVTLAGLLVQGAGMGLGIFLGPILVNRYGGYQDHLGRYVILHLLLRITAVGAFGAGLAVLCMGIQLNTWAEDAELLDSSLANPWLWLFWFATVPLNFALSAQGGVQTVINIGSVPPGMQELAQGITTSVQFLCGYAGGVIMPSIALDCAYVISKKWLHYEMTNADMLATGVLCLCYMCAVLFFTVMAARNEAFKQWQRFELGLATSADESESSISSTEEYSSSDTSAHSVE